MTYETIWHGISNVQLHSATSHLHSIRTLKFGSESTWIGYWNYNSHTPTTPGLWKDQNGVGTTAVFTAFAAGEPNDGPGGNSCIQNYGEAGWNDNACSVQFYTICMCKCNFLKQSSHTIYLLQLFILKLKAHWLHK